MLQLLAKRSHMLWLCSLDIGMCERSMNALCIAVADQKQTGAADTELP